MTRIERRRIGPLAAVLAAWMADQAAAAQTAEAPRTGRQVYESVCIACHGPDGRGGVNLELEKIIKPPDFTDCAFAAREPDRGFLAVAHDGGPARGFSPLMAAWSGLFTEQELGLAVSHIRTFCADDRWPRGELNLPLPLVTGKAFPEDEAVLRVGITDDSVTTRAVYERRFGALNQWEIAVPVAAIDAPDGGGTAGLGDLALGYKRVLAHSRSAGRIVSLSGEVTLPTGSEQRGLGDGVVVVEPFLTYGQLLGGGGFLQAQAGVGVPASGDHDAEVFWRAAIGRSFEQGRFGRQWSPMLEVLAARTLASGARVEWDVLPGAQITLNQRQHVRLGLGVRIPVTEAASRSPTVTTYLLWDWYEGGFSQGW
jgi:Cytochrome C oxidase, cbb3-type, subunit III